MSHASAQEEPFGAPLRLRLPVTLTYDEAALRMGVRSLGGVVVTSAVHATAYRQGSRTLPSMDRLFVGRPRPLALTEGDTLRLCAWSKDGDVTLQAFPKAPVGPPFNMTAEADPWPCFE